MLDTLGDTEGEGLARWMGSTERAPPGLECNTACKSLHLRGLLAGPQLSDAYCSPPNCIILPHVLQSS